MNPCVKRFQSLCSGGASGRAFGPKKANLCYVRFQARVYRRDALALSALHARSMEQKEEGAQARLMQKKYALLRSVQRAAQAEAKRECGGPERAQIKKRESACNTTHFPRSHLPQYLARPTVFNFRERTGSGVFIVV